MHMPDKEPHQLTPGDWCWFEGLLWAAVPTSGAVAHLANHTVTGTRDAPTVTPSILSRRGKPDEWHGYLTNGEWRSC